MTRAKRTDANQKKIVGTLRKCGATVGLLHMVGGGMPDAVVGYFGVNELVEIKDGSKPLSAQKLTTAQIEFHQMWKGKITILRNEDDCIALINKMRVKGARWAVYAVKK